LQTAAVPEGEKTDPPFSTGARPGPGRATFIVLVGLGLAGLYAGWTIFWFMTDDAYIAFRYIENSLRGFGYVWNPPPFLPVEGYTSFLWVVLLEGIWRVAGATPPESANWVALFFSGLTLIVSAEMVFQLARRMPVRWISHVLVGLVLGYLLLNRSFLAWSSSGLETAMFGLFLILWAWRLNFGPRSALNYGTVSLVAALAALTRPDGLLFAAMTFGLFLLDRIIGPKQKRFSRKAFLAICSPFAVVLVHLLWRYGVYGQWLPNTYYAKVSEAMPKSGAVYAFSFLLEFCLWPVVAIVGVALFAFMRNLLRQLTAQSQNDGLGAAVEAVLSERLLISGTIAVFAAHFVYYTLIVGGDHFEYRPYNHLFPLIFVSLVWSLRELRIRPVRVVVAASVCVALSLPVPLTHWLLTRDLTTRDKTAFMRVPISPAWPQYLHWYSRPFDRTQSWLIGRLVCCRHQEHKVFSRQLLIDLPSRSEGQKMRRNGFPIFVTGCVGVAGWVLPEAYVIDSLGLNDYVVARAPIPAANFGGAAHSRKAPKGYLEDFRPNVTFDAAGLHVAERMPPLTAAEIVEIEAKWRKWLRDRAEKD